MGAVMPPLQIAVKAAMVPPADPIPMRAGVLVLELVMGAMVALLETVVLPIVPMAPAAVMGQSRSAQTQGNHGADHCEEGRTHYTLLFRMIPGTPSGLNRR